MEDIVATVAVRSGARFHKALDIARPPPLPRHGFTPELRLSLRSSLLSDPSVFYFGFHLFVYLKPLSAPPPTPLSFPPACKQKRCQEQLCWPA